MLQEQERERDHEGTTMPRETPNRVCERDEMMGVLMVHLPEAMMAMHHAAEAEVLVPSP